VARGLELGRGGDKERLGAQIRGVLQSTVENGTSARDIARTVAQALAGFIVVYGLSSDIPAAAEEIIAVIREEVA
jgi:hypothetical protein